MNARGLFMLVVLGMCLVAVAALSNGNLPAPAPAAKATPTLALFEGTSNKGNLEEALEAAVESAMTSRKGIADAMVEWKLKEVSGAQGGIAGVNRLTVTIEVKPQ